MRKLTIRVIPTRSELREKAKTKRMNERMSALVNLTYALAMAVESEAVDCGEEVINGIASRLRAKVHESTEVADDFGEWAERVEGLVSSVLTNSRLATLCYLTCALATRMQENYRQYDPFFDFYQMYEIKKLKEYANQYKLDRQELEVANKIIRSIMMSQTI